MVFLPSCCISHIFSYRILYVLCQKRCRRNKRNYPPASAYMPHHLYYNFDVHIKRIFNTPFSRISYSRQYPDRIKKRTKHLLYTLLTYPVCWILIAVYALGVQSFYVAPNKATIERPYIKHRIEGTIQAYGIDNIDETVYPTNGKINSQSVSLSQEHIENLIITDKQNALSMLNLMPDSKQFYLFKLSVRHLLSILS